MAFASRASARAVGDTPNTSRRRGRQDRLDVDLHAASAVTRHREHVRTVAALRLRARGRAPQARTAVLERLARLGSTVGRVQLPPTQPWKLPSRVTTAVSPTWAETGGLRPTTVASANGSPRRARSAASCSRSRRTLQAPGQGAADLFVVLGVVDVAQGRLGPAERDRLVLVPAHHLLAAALVRDGQELREERPRVERGRGLHVAVAGQHQSGARRRGNAPPRRRSSRR